MKLYLRRRLYTGGIHRLYTCAAEVDTTTALKGASITSNESSGVNATYRFTDSFIGFVEVLAHFYSVMADECTDITTVEELSILCRWVAINQKH